MIVKTLADVPPPPGLGVFTVTLAVPADRMSAAVIAAFRVVELTKVVVRSLPFHLTVLPVTKFEPVTVSVKALPAAKVELGFRPEIAGAGLLMVNVAEPLTAILLLTVIVAVPAVAISAAVMAAVSWLLLTKLVVRSLPFHLTVLPLGKPDPFTVSVNPAEPAVADEGLIFDSVALVVFMVKGSELEVPPLGAGLKTVT